MNKLDQQILVIKRDRLFSTGVWEGLKLSRNIDDFLELIDTHGEYVRRGDAEDNESYKQIIPQICLIAKNRLYLHQIPKTGSEKRLHDMFAIFLGGHVEKFDGSVVEAADREFNEEITYLGKITDKIFIGAINLDDEPVNRVHLGLVWVYFGDNLKIGKNSDLGISEGNFLGWEHLVKKQNQMTHWSKLAFPVIRERFEKI